MIQPASTRPSPDACVNAAPSVQHRIVATSPVFVYAVPADVLPMLRPTTIEPSPEICSACVRGYTGVPPGNE
jgi:hypothetical protein